MLDLFGGSGSTLIACEQLSRKCYTMEYDPRYVDVIVQRWEDFTGEKGRPSEITIPLPGPVFYSFPAPVLS